MSMWIRRRSFRGALRYCWLARLTSSGGSWSKESLSSRDGGVRKGSEREERWGLRCVVLGFLRCGEDVGDL